MKAALYRVDAEAEREAMRVGVEAVVSIGEQDERALCEEIYAKARGPDFERPMRRIEELGIRLVLRHVSPRGQGFREDPPGTNQRTRSRSLSRTEPADSTRASSSIAAAPSSTRRYSP